MILIIDDDRAIRATLGMLLKRAGYEVRVAENPEQALAAVREKAPGVIIMDMNFSPGETSGTDGLELLQKMKILVPSTPVFLITAWGSIPLAVEGMKLGAFDFITKPWDSRLLLSRIATALTLAGPREEEREAPQTFDRCGIVGESPALRKVLDTVARIASTDASVLITGENGTGKELIARAIHANSGRRSGPFVEVNLGGMPQSLFESEMFGHAKGAFTGAVARRDGRFKMADKGTIFLDEIGDLDLNCQVKMLRALQEHSFEPLGESRPVKVDIRVVSATNADLQAMLADKSFREDLYYRINTITLRLPALRERRDDIPRLVRHFASLHPDGAEFSADAMELLQRLPYPGNIRQLKNIVDRAILVSGERVITPDDIDTSAQSLPGAAASAASASGTLEEIERSAITAALENAGGNIASAAANLGITRQALYRRMEKYGIKS